MFHDNSSKSPPSLSLLRNITSSHSHTCTSQLPFNSRLTTSPVSRRIVSTPHHQLLTTMCWIFHEYWACGHPSDHHQVFERNCKLYLTTQANDDTACYRRGLKPRATAYLSQCPANNVTHHFMWDGPFTEQKCWLCMATDTSLIPYGCIIPARLSQNIPMVSILHRGIEPVERRPADHGKYRLPPIPTNSGQQCEIQAVYPTQPLTVAVRVGHWLEDLPSLTPQRATAQRQVMLQKGIVTPSRVALAAAEQDPWVSQQPKSLQNIPHGSRQAIESQGQPFQDIWAGFPASDSHLDHNQPHEQRYGMLERQNLLSAGQLLPQPQMESSYNPNYSAQPIYASIDPSQAMHWTPRPPIFEMNEARHRARAEAEALYQARARAYHLAQVQALSAGQSPGLMLSHQSQVELRSPLQMSPTPQPNTRWHKNPAPAIYLKKRLTFENVPSSKHSSHSPPGSPRLSRARAKCQRRQSPIPVSYSPTNDTEMRPASSRRSLRNRPKISYIEQSSSEDEAEKDAELDDYFIPFSTSSSLPTRSSLDQAPTDFPQAPKMPPH